MLFFLLFKQIPELFLNSFIRWLFKYWLSIFSEFDVVRYKVNENIFMGDAQLIIAQDFYKVVQI